MSFQNRDDYTSAASSEKVTLAWVGGVERLLTWTLDSGAVYKRSVIHFVVGLSEATLALTEVGSIGAITAGTWFFDSVTNQLYVQTTASSNPQTDEEMIGKYRFFFSNGPMSASWDLTDSAVHVHYEGRIQLSPNFKHKIGIEQQLISLVGNGTLKLINTDGGLDEIFDTIVFENKDVTIFSWNRDLDFSQAKVIYRGIITNKRFKNDSVSFMVKDQLFALEQEVPQRVYDDTDTVNDDIKGHYKRWIYGRVDGLQIQSTDQIGDGYTISGTVSTETPEKELTRFESFPAASTFPSSGTGAFFKINDARDRRLFVYWYDVDNGNTQPALGTSFTYREINVDASDDANTVAELTSVKLADDFKIIPGFGNFLTETEDFGITTDATAETSGITITKVKDGTNPEQINGIGTLFLSECSPGDEFIVGDQQFQIDTIIDDTTLNLDDTPRFSFSGQTTNIIPEISTVIKNRDFFVADHATAKLTKTVANVIQLNRVELNDTLGLLPGDFIEFTTGERKEIKNVAPGNIVVLRDNLIIIPATSSTVTRQPIQSIFVSGKDVQPDNFTISNSSTETTIVLDANTEFELARTVNFAFVATFTNGTRSITTANDVDLRETLKPRDFIRPQDLLFTTFYEILEVREKEILIRTPFTDPTITDDTEGRLPNYIGDDTIVSANVLGRTVDNTPSGTWITTAAETNLDLIGHANLTEINTASFATAAIENSQLVSLSIPLTPSGGATTIKEAIDLMSRSTFSAVTLDNDLKIQMRVLEIQIPDDPVQIFDNDVIDWEIITTNGNNIRNTIIKYRHQDINPATLEFGTRIQTYDNEYVEKYVGTNKTQELDVYLYNDFSARIMSHRLSYWNSLSRADLMITTDLRLENLEIGDTVILNFVRLYKRFGDNTSRKKAMTVVGKTVNGERIILGLTDLGNLYNRSSVITPNDAPDWTSATEDEKLKYGYITANNGIVNDEEDTFGTHLIS